jgi:hypothetical protein
VPDAQNAAGGVLHWIVVLEYVQLPPLQVPLAAYVRRAEPLAQSAAGGVVQLTPAQGSPMHAPLLQPLGQLWSVAV